MASMVGQVLESRIEAVFEFLNDVYEVVVWEDLRAYKRGSWVAD